jgi:hypothetical protein
VVEAQQVDQQPEEAEGFVQRDGRMIPLHRDDLDSVKSIKFSLAEVDRLTAFQEWLALTINPHTNQPFIPRNEFSAMIHLCLNFTFTWMGKIAEDMTRAEEGDPP